MFTAIGILMLYFNVLTMFSGFLSYDTRRQYRNEADCCGAMECLGDKVVKEEKMPIFFES